MSISDSSSSSSSIDTQLPGAPDPADYDFDPYSVWGAASVIDGLQEATTVEDYSRLLMAKPDDFWPDHIDFGNTKIAKEVAIFNLGSATDCPHLGETECQVDADDCYAYNAEGEGGYAPMALPKRRRQELLWKESDLYLFTRALQRTFERKQHEITALRLSESGDIRTQQDVRDIQYIADELDVPVYLYTASSGLDWSEAPDVTINASNEWVEGADRQYDAVPTVDDIPEDGIQCPYDMEGSDIKCGECRLCIDPDMQEDVYITLHT
ncbi:hypothetical protein [Halosegnis longus]|uniref:hypothetical protein n=1 Tax=Halosegnis longus TaxID=2216012 RepID=UPI00129DB5A8|nr:hypothetical protein [Halosegnis longus]